ncbi:MAG: zf-HC2 domain-containing protein [Clostridia bacterium]|nr:zf-HC2 domain-containing protein [Clostridia bacterium]
MSKQCEIVGDLLPLYVDGVCSEASGELVREHMDTCPRCRELCEQLRSHGSEELLKREKDGVVRRHERKESRRILRYLFLSAALLYLPTLLLIVLHSEPDGTSFIAIDRWFVLAVLFLFTVPFYLAFIEIGRLVCGAMEKRKKRIRERIFDFIGASFAVGIVAVGVIATALDRDDWIGPILNLAVLLILNWLVSAIVNKKRPRIGDTVKDKVFWACLAIMAATVALSVTLLVTAGGSKARPDPQEPMPDEAVCRTVYDL